MKNVLTLIKIVILILFSLTVQGENIRINQDIELIEISEGFYVHKAISSLPGSSFKFSSNGMLVIKNGKALIIDTPVTIEQTETIYNFLKDSMGVVMVETFIGGHFHIDCIGGMDFFKRIGVKTILNERTKQKCINLNLPLPDFTYDSIYAFNFEGIIVECHYFGGGHTADNTVVFFPESRILFGDCLIKSLDSPNLGNLQDAVVSEWKPTVEKIIKTLSPIKCVVPGHGDFGNDELLRHTIRLVEQQK